MPAITAISQVFEEHRALAFGISSSGVGIGKFLGPLLISKLDETYGWRGTLLLLGGIILNLCICALIYYRHGVQLEQLAKKMEAQREKDEDKPTGIVVGREDGLLVTEGKEPSILNGFARDRFGYASSNFSLALAGAPELGDDAKRTLPVENGIVGSFGEGHLSNGIIENFKRDLALEGNLTSIAAALSTSSLFLSTAETISMEHLPGRMSYRCMINGSTRSRLHINHPSTQVSTQDLDLTTENAIKTKVPSIISLPVPEEGFLPPGKKKKTRKAFKMNAYLMKDPQFLILCINNLLFSMGYSLAHVHLPAFSIDCGLSLSQGNMLISATGISSLVGKIVLGWAAQLPRLSPISVYTITLTLTAISTLLFPSCVNFPQFLILALFFGFISGSFGAVLPSLVVSMTAVDLLPSAYGFLLVFEAGGFLFGPTIAGWVYDASGLYSSSFYFGGSVMLIASLIMFWPWYKRRGCDDEMPPVPEHVEVPAA